MHSPTDAVRLGPLAAHRRPGSTSGEGRSTAPLRTLRADGEVRQSMPLSRHFERGAPRDDTRA